MNFPMILPKNYCFALLFLLLLLPAASLWAAPFDILPPIPAGIIAKAQKGIHPFLLADEDRFREGRREFRQESSTPRYKEFKKRVEGFFDKESPWYLGEGPLSGAAEFHPGKLSDEDLRFYSKMLCETALYMGYEQERWTINRLMKEVSLLLDELAPGEAPSKPSITPDQTSFSAKDAYLLALTSILYDMVYFRFDTVDRHAPNNRMRELRDRLAAFCNSSKSETLPPDEQIILGTSLGLSTLFCISVYSFEWEKKEAFNLQSYLPDLYRAAALTRKGFDGMIAPDKRIRASLPRLESVFLIAIPWLERLKENGYYFAPGKGMFAEAVAALESHRMPSSSKIIHPNYAPPLSNPWIPSSYALFKAIDPKMYADKNVKEASGTVQAVASENEDLPIPPPQPRTLQELKERIFKENPKGRPLTLREQLEYLGQPRKEIPEPLPTLASAPSSREAGWTRPANVELPSLWGAVYWLAARENPSSEAKSIWEDLASETDSHPLTYLHKTTLTAKGATPADREDLIQYPESGFTLYSTRSLRSHYILSSQAAAETVITPTYSIHHESFFMNDNGFDWRWFHEIPAEGALKSAPGASSIKTASPVLSPIFSCWSSDSPVGKSYVLRRHFEGAGAAYTAAIHFPAQKASGGRIDHIVFSLPPNSAGLVDSDVREFIQIVPEKDELYDEPSSFEEWQMKRSKERRGEIEQAKGEKLRIFLSADALKNAAVSDGSLGTILDIELATPDKPFFYMITPEQPGREQFKPKYASIPMPGIRVLEWRHGVEMLAINMGDGIHNPFVDSDADIAIMIQENSSKRISYMMVNGTYLRAKFMPSEGDFTLLADTKGERMNVVWNSRRLYANLPPRSMSVFHAPDIVGFDCPGTVIKYGRTGRQAVVWEKK
ncbi:MAG: hypothetical protein AB1656_16760 [Candidatus Omnitrophota bacterium]